MAANPLNFKRNHADVVAAESAIAPILKSANINTISIEGKEVSASDAPLASKIVALGKLIATGDKTEDSAAAIQANGELAAQLEASEGKLVAANSTIAAQTQKINDLTGKLNTATDSVNTLNARNTELGTLLKASTEEGIRLTAQANTQKLYLAKDCLAWGCVDFKGADGKPLAKDASDAEITKAAEAISFADLNTAKNGAINSNMAKLGVSVATLPGAPAATTTSKPVMARAAFLALDPKAQSNFFKSGGKITD
jgi:hypothetical protein